MQKKYYQTAFGDSRGFITVFGPNAFRECNSSIVCKPIFDLSEIRPPHNCVISTRAARRPPFCLVYEPELSPVR